MFSGYYWGKAFGTLNEKKWLTRIIFLETVAGVPGMIAAMVRHLKSLRHMERDHGWIHTLLGLRCLQCTISFMLYTLIEEAENERMHLLTALVLRKPGILFKLAVIGAQGTLYYKDYILLHSYYLGIFVGMFGLAYVFSPRFCHRFVGYLEEEAVKTYSHCLEVNLLTVVINLIHFMAVP